MKTSVKKHLNQVFYDRNPKGKERSKSEEERQRKGSGEIRNGPVSRYFRFTGPPRHLPSTPQFTAM
jgi:hypothetical protein